MRFLLLLSFVGLALCAKKDYTGYQVWRSYPTAQEHEFLKVLFNDYNLDVWADMKMKGGFTDYMIPPEVNEALARALRLLRVDYSVWIEDVQVAIDNSISTPLIGPGSDFYNTYHTFDEIQSWITSFATEYNSAAVSVTVESVGTSYEGREFSALKISANGGSSTKRSFVINCGIHAREWVTPASCMYYAEFLLSNYGVSGEETVTNNMNAVDFYIIPASNPDGYVFTHTDDRMWRKTRSSNNCNCKGVDPNRNFDANWQGEGASGLCCSDTYYGPSAFSEACTAAQRDFVQGLSNVKGYIDVHAYSQMWMFPYGYTYDRSNDHATLDVIARDSVAAIRSVHSKLYEPGQISEVIYVASGSSADYFYDAVGIKCSWAVELRDKGQYGFLLPENQIQPTAEESFAGIMTIATAISSGQCD